MTMKALLINGSPHKEGCTFTALSEIADTLKKNGIESEIFHIGVKPIASCIACGKCRETCKCVFDTDGVNEIGARLNEFDAIVLGSPVYYAGPSGQLCSFCDRLFFSNSKKMAGKLAAAVVSCRRGGATASFDRLNKYFTITNMQVVGSQYWNMVHGFTPEDVRKDIEGLQTMRTLAQNMAWLLKCIELGKKHGINKPEYEPIKFTNFIN
ncbi:MAG: flavodoxin family protein [Elusimicrobiaceae bacterium]|nr:flavodoxin family protein [Elusimicrobiaceae bacterium]